MRRSLLLGPRVVPTEPVEIDWSHPLARGLVACCVPGGASGFADLCDNGALTPGTGRMGTAQVGPGWETATFSDAATAPLETAWQISEGTIFCRIFKIGAGNGSGLPWIFGSDNAADSNREWMIYDNGSVYEFVGLGTYTTFNNAANSVVTQQASLCVTFDASYSIDTYYSGDNGFWTASGTGASSPSYASNLLYLGGNANCIVQQGSVYNYPLPADLVAWLAAEPFAMLRPRARRRVYVGATGTLIATDATSGLEHLALDLRDAGTPAAWTGTPAGSLSAPATWIAGVNAGSAAPLETRTGLTATVPAAFEHTQTAQRDTSIWLEHAALVSLAGYAPLAYGVGVAAAMRLPVEWLGHAVLVTSDSNTPLTWVLRPASVSVTFTTLAAPAAAPAAPPSPRSAVQVSFPGS